MYDPSVPESIVVHMRSVFAQFGIDDTIENRLYFLEAAKEKWMKDPVLGSPKHYIEHIAITMVINDLKVEQILRKKKDS
jgi:hypothetical protein